MINKYSNKHNQVKNPNWREADQLAIYKRGREVELGATENNISQWSERDLNPQPTDFKSSALTTRPRCLLLQVTYQTRKTVFDHTSTHREERTSTCLEMWLNTVLSV